MFVEERHKYILDILDRDGKIFVNDLSMKFNVSKSMIRKDLRILEKKNLLQRTYGGAININHTIFNRKSFLKRVWINTDLEETIAQKAYNQIKEKDIVFLDASSISYILIKLLIKNNKDVTVITNMVEIASLIPLYMNIHIFFIGGDYNVLTGGNIGSNSIEQIKLFCCNKAFIGCSGIDLRDGNVSVSVSEEANTKKAIISISKEAYLLSLNEKFNTDGTYIFSNIIEFCGIITETLPSKKIITFLNRYNVNLIK